MANPLFARKPLSMLLAELKGENRLRRVLGPVQLTSLGIGAVIGTGIFVTTGAVAKTDGGPALMLSYVVAGIVCVFAALCYAEFASMVPVAGSAYTYAYATLGELFAWIIGWDLILEYAVSSATVADGWSGYFQSVLNVFGWKLPHAISGPVVNYDPQLGKLVATGSLINLPAALIVVLVTVVLVIGIRESANVNTTLVAIKVGAVLFVIAVGAFYINRANWHPFAPYGLTGLQLFGHTLLGQSDAGGRPLGVLAGAALAFFSYIGFDSVSTHSEEAKNPQRDVPIGILVSLVLCTLLYIGVVAVLTGMVPYDQLDINAPVSDAFRRVGLRWAQFLIAAAGARRHHLRAAGDHAEPGPHPPRHRPRRPAPPGLLRRRPRALPHAVEVDDRDRPLRRPARRVPADQRAADAGQHGDAARLRDRLRGGADHAAHAPGGRAAVPRPLVPLVPILGIASCLLLMFSLPSENWLRLFVWLGLGLVIYFAYGRRHSNLARLRAQGNEPDEEVKTA